MAQITRASWQELRISWENRWSDALNNYVRGSGTGSEGPVVRPPTRGTRVLTYYTGEKWARVWGPAGHAVHARGRSVPGRRPGTLAPAGPAHGPESAGVLQPAEVVGDGGHLGMPRAEDPDGDPEGPAVQSPGLRKAPLVLVD